MCVALWLMSWIYGGLFQSKQFLKKGLGSSLWRKTFEKLPRNLVLCRFLSLIMLRLIVFDALVLSIRVHGTNSRRKTRKKNLEWFQNDFSDTVNWSPATSLFQCKQKTWQQKWNLEISPATFNFVKVETIVFKFISWLVILLCLCCIEFSEEAK